MHTLTYTSSVGSEPCVRTAVTKNQDFLNPITFRQIPKRLTSGVFVQDSYKLRPHSNYNTRNFPNHFFEIVELECNRLTSVQYPQSRTFTASSSVVAGTMPIHTVSPVCPSWLGSSSCSLYIMRESSCELNDRCDCFGAWVARGPACRAVVESAGSLQLRNGLVETWFKIPLPPISSVMFGQYLEEVVAQRNMLRIRWWYTGFQVRYSCRWMATVYRRFSCLLSVLINPAYTKNGRLVDCSTVITRNATTHQLEN